VLLRAARDKPIETLRFQAEILKRNRERLQAAVRGTGGDESFVGDRYFIETVCAMHYPCILDAQQRESLRDPFNERTLPDPYNLKWRTRGIRERTQQIERGADAELAPN